MIIRYLYEAQHSSLCRFAMNCLNESQVILSFTNLTLSSYDCICIGYFLSFADKRTRLIIANCGVDHQGCKCLINSLINESNFGNNSTGNYNDDEKGRLPNQVCVMDISNCNISDQGAHYIAEGLRCSKIVIQEVNLEFCKLSSEGAMHLSTALSESCFLEKIDLTGNELRDEGTKHISTALVNSSLKELRLSSCSMTDIGLAHLSIALGENTSLKRLYIYNCCDLFENTFTNKGILHLITNLKSNSSLSLLCLPADFKDHIISAAVEVHFNEARRFPIKVTGIN